MAAIVEAATDGDDQGSARGGGERGGRAIGERRATEEVDAEGVARGDGYLVDHHRDRARSPERLAGGGHGSLGVDELHAKGGARALPESVEPSHRQVLRDHGELHVARDRARREVPVARVGGRDDDAVAPRQRPPPGLERSLVDPHAPQGPPARERKPEELDRGDAELPVHLPRRLPRVRDPRDAHRLLDVPAPDTEDAPGNPSEHGAEHAERRHAKTPSEPGATNGSAGGRVGLERDGEDIGANYDEELPLRVARVDELAHPA